MVATVRINSSHLLLENAGLCKNRRYLPKSLEMPVFIGISGREVSKRYLPHTSLTPPLYLPRDNTNFFIFLRLYFWSDIFSGSKLTEFPMVDNESLGDLQGRFEGGIREVQGRCKGDTSLSKIPVNTGIFSDLGRYRHFLLKISFQQIIWNYWYKSLTLREVCRLLPQRKTT